ncbi:MAG: M23 family metallopeptidase [Treponema sp.]|nr:M23 family metallopeptidase [Treponema sp.]
MAKGVHHRERRGFLRGGPGGVFPALLFLFLWGTSTAQETPSFFPFIERLDPRDPVFKQYLEDVDQSRRLLFGSRGRRQEPRELAESLRIYAYALPEQEDILRIAARCNIPYSALATLNGVRHPSQWKAPVLLPSMPGIFIAETPQGDLEQLMAASRNTEDGAAVTLPGSGGGRRLLFFPGDDFSPTERSYFLNTGFHFPLRTYRVSSPFGIRPSPFTGKPQNHRGLDLAAPLGTEVYAAKEGVVAELGADPVYGNYIVIAHGDNWTSLYGHLSSFSVSLHSAVARDSVIGRVGSTGQSTGPHLHFELKKNGAAQDPSKLLFRGSR